ncbi:hypothetical protein PAXRUDRAFT_9670 [Paxillus rubicundulus Ve08.2h10]|uniref:Unplaced genomic scaffold scaffold_78, whole genome shotgun sequence n=1 Tax=Paxillus rubicundulus Ve08.2h10 TaxID=930991 RepID=A0A0D0DUT4_9AGAM|nr:hypothetical protein PAXRUDRAFT_9670 [Paxillus rubicundulus Ve08.2h10]
MPTTETAQRSRRAANPEVKHHNLLERIRLIVKILADQHVDVNRASGGITPLQSLWLSRGPEMGERTPPDVFVTQRDKTRFRALLAKYPSETIRCRPPRIRIFPRCADLSIVQHRVEATTLGEPPSLEAEGYLLVLHRRLTDFIDEEDAEIDPVFKYALRHIDFSPISMGSSSIRNADTIKQQEDWNSF